MSASDDSPNDGEGFHRHIAFVLRLRTRGSDHRTFVVDVDDVQTRECWRFNSLDEAFGRIRTATAKHIGASGGSGKPN